MRVLRNFAGLLGVSALVTLLLAMASLWADLASAAAPGGQLHGEPDGKVLQMLKSLAEHRNMRTTSGGAPVNSTQRGRFEHSFQAHFNVSPIQFAFLTAVFDTHDVSQAIAVLGGTPPPAPPGTAPPYVQRTFSADRTRCCGYMLRVRFIRATLYARDKCVPVWHVVKECVRGCRATYYADKSVLRGVVGGEDYRIHVFPPWTTGIPDHVFSKSGRAVLSTQFVTDQALHQARSQSGFDTLAKIYSGTVGMSAGGGTSPLTGPVLTEVWALFALLKVRQGVGPWLWRKPDGAPLDVTQPRETTIFDRTGNQGGLNFWPGLRVAVDRELQPMRLESPWVRHECNVCTKAVVRHGEEIVVQAAAVDGITAVRVQCCAVYNCTEDLLKQGGARYCARHEDEIGWRCCVTSPPVPMDAAPAPPCQQPRQPGTLSCALHSNLEHDFRRYNAMGGWHAQAKARKAGNAVQSTYARYLRGMFAVRTTFGQFVATYNCGIVANIASLYESEGQAEVARALNKIWPIPARRPRIMFFDMACRRRDWLITNPDPSWAGTINYVDRFHMQTHKTARCLEFCSPERRDNTLLWRRDQDDRPEFLWNTSIAESVNAQIHRLGPVVKPMNRVMADFVLMNNLRIHNELLLTEKLLGHSPRFVANTLKYNPLGSGREGEVSREPRTVHRGKYMGGRLDARIDAEFTEKMVRVGHR